jgi:adenosyl cobinamide kinase/adenosyl cobinamide phosphate guanylyltransferase
MIVLVLGGARSGKSQVAEELAKRWAARSSGGVTFVATAAVDDADAGFAARIEEHRSRRPAAWETVEVPLGADLGAVIDRCPPCGVALVDSLGTWLAGCPDFAADVAGLTAALDRRRSGGDVILVSDEVGLGVHPETQAGLEFRDALGALNREVATAADDVLLVVAGRVLSLPPAPEMVRRP